MADLDEDRYVLEIYEPNSSGHDVLVTYKSPYPFPAMQAGQIIRPLGDGELPAGRALMVRHVEHMIWLLAEKPKFKMCIHTKSVSDHPHDWDNT
jgi:hypothetical protein